MEPWACVACGGECCACRDDMGVYVHWRDGQPLRRARRSPLAEHDYEEETMKDFLGPAGAGSRSEGR